MGKTRAKKLTTTAPVPNEPDHRPAEMVVISFLTLPSIWEGSGLSLTAMRKSNSRVGWGKATDGLGKWSSDRLQASSTLLCEGYVVSMR